jgi:hypothetical protein
VSGTLRSCAPLVTAEQAVADWLDVWAGRPSRNGPFVITIHGEPRWQGWGMASRAVRLAARWALSLPGVRAVELRIDQDMVEFQRRDPCASVSRISVCTGGGRVARELPPLTVEAPGVWHICGTDGGQVISSESGTGLNAAVVAGPRSAALRDLDRDVGGLDGGDREHSWFQAEFVGGFAAEQ